MIKLFTLYVNYLTLQHFNMKSRFIQRSNDLLIVVPKNNNYPLLFLEFISINKFIPEIINEHYEHFNAIYPISQLKKVSDCVRYLNDNS